MLNKKIKNNYKMGDVNDKEMTWGNDGIDHIEIGKIA